MQTLAHEVPQRVKADLQRLCSAKAAPPGYNLLFLVTGSIVFCHTFHFVDSEEITP
jgi:hypothetical protein